MPNSVENQKTFTGHLSAFLPEIVAAPGEAVDGEVTAPGAGDAEDIFAG